MERLTEHETYNAVNRCSEYSSCYSCRKKCYISGLCEKLGQLEDVLEKYGIESAEELDNIIHYNTTNALIESENKTMLELQNEQLQHQLAVKDRALELACKEAWGNKASFVSSDYGKKLQMPKSILDFLYLKLKRS